jgi:hypothetical protein
MRIGRCPVCHAHLHLDAMVQDEAGRDLMTILVNLPDDLGSALVGYLGLFRPSRSDLANDRALRLARDVLALESDPARLAWALSETVESLRAKGEARRMTNHNYLKRVLEGAPSAAQGAQVARIARDEKRATRTKTEAAMLALEALKNG